MESHWRALSIGETSLTYILKGPDCCTENRLKYGGWEVRMLNQVRAYGGLDQGGSSRDGEKWLGSEYTLRVKICGWITFRVQEKDVEDNSNIFDLSNLDRCN